MDEAEAPAAESRRIQGAVTQIVRWAGRSEVRRRLLGSAGRDLTVVEVDVLRTIVAAGPLRVSELAERQGVDKSTMTPQVHRLAERGLVERQPDPHDRRGVLVGATARARRVRSRMDAAGAAVIDDILRHWPAADRADLAVLLERFAHEIRDQPTGRPPSDGATSQAGPVTTRLGSD